MFFEVCFLVCFLYTVWYFYTLNKDNNFLLFVLRSIQVANSFLAFSELFWTWTHYDVVLKIGLKFFQLCLHFDRFLAENRNIEMEIQYDLETLEFLFFYDCRILDIQLLTKFEFKL